VEFIGIDVHKRERSPTAHQGALSYAKARKLLHGREQILANRSIAKELVPWLPQKQLDARQDGSAQVGTFHLSQEGRATSNGNPPLPSPPELDGERGVSPNKRVFSLSLNQEPA